MKESQRFDSFHAQLGALPMMRQRCAVRKIDSIVVACQMLGS